MHVNREPCCFSERTVYFKWLTANLGVATFLLFIGSLLPATVMAQATICGYVFFDSNQDGVKNTGELVLAQHVMNLDDMTLISNGQGGSFATSTDAEGHFCFFANSIGFYMLRTGVPEGMTRLTTPMQQDLKTGAMSPHFVNITNSSQEVTANFGFFGAIDEEAPIFCQGEEKDKSICVHNNQYWMQATPNNNGETEVKSMQVKKLQDSRGKDAYVGDNNTSIVAVTEKDGDTRSRVRNGSTVDDFVITVGKTLSDTENEFSLNAKINANDSISFEDPEMPGVFATAVEDGFVVTDNDSPGVSVSMTHDGDITATDSENPTMGLFVNGSTGQVSILDSEYPSTMAVVNADGSYTVTDSEFPNLIATFYANNEYVVEDIENEVTVYFDTAGNFTIIDSKNGLCMELPNTRGLFGSIFKGITKIFRSITRFVSKVAGFVGQIARFVARVAPVISKALKVVAVVARVAAVIFPGACQFFCAVAAFAESASLIADKVGFFADKVANIAEAVQNGSLIQGMWVGSNPECNTRRRVRQAQEGDVLTTFDTQPTLIGRTLSSFLCYNNENATNSTHAGEWKRYAKWGQHGGTYFGYVISDGPGATLSNLAYRITGNRNDWRLLGVSQDVQGDSQLIDISPLLQKLESRLRNNVVQATLNIKAEFSDTEELSVPSEATIDYIYENGKGVKIECRAAAKVVLLRGLQQTLIPGESAYNMISSRTFLPSLLYPNQSNINAVPYLEEKQNVTASSSLKGDWGYFRNSEDYVNRIHGSFNGLNVIKTSPSKFYSFPEKKYKTESEWIQELKDENKRVGALGPIKGWTGKVWFFDVPRLAMDLFDRRN